MSGPPHHPHRQVPSGGSPWNHHLQVPNYFARQPQLAHMSSTNDAHHTPLLHQPTWHTPTTNDPPPPAIKPPPPSHTTLFDVMSNLTAAELILRQSAAPSTATVDLSVTRNGGGGGSTANGESGQPSHAPISLSVRDTNKINSLPASELQDIHAIALTKPSHVAKSISPGLEAGKKRTNIRVDSILERLNPTADGKDARSDFGSFGSTGTNFGGTGSFGSTSTNFGGTSTNFGSSSTNFGSTSTNFGSTSTSFGGTSANLSSSNNSSNSSTSTTLSSTTLTGGTTLTSGTTLVSGTTLTSGTSGTSNTNIGNISSNINSNDENSNSSSTTNNTAVLLEDGASNFSNDDSLDGNKSRRKRKPSKTVRVPTDGGTTVNSTDCTIEKDTAKLDSKSANSNEKVNTETIKSGTLKSSTEVLKSSTDNIASAKSTESDTNDLNLANKVDVNKLESDETASDGGTVSRTRRKGTDSTTDNEPVRKSSSDSETIDNIAAMVEGLKSTTDGTAKNSLNNTKYSSTKNGTTNNNPKDDKTNKESPKSPKNSCTNPKDGGTASGTTKESEIRPQLGLIRVKDDLMPPKSTTLLTAAQRKAISTEPFSTSSTANTSSSTDSSFVDVENKLEEMFAGIEDLTDKSDTGPVGSTGGTTEDSLLKLDESLPSTSQAVLSTSTPTSSAHPATPNPTNSPENTTKKSDKNKSNQPQAPKKKRKSQKSDNAASNDPDSASPSKRRRLSQSSTSPSKKSVNSKPNSSQKGVPSNAALKSAPNTNIPLKSASKGVASGSKQSKKDKSLISGSKIDKDVYAYDSGSNASSSRSRGPFIQIRGARDSPLSVQVVNTPTMEDEEKERRKAGKNKKFHDDSEYRHKVRSKGLHCSTLSNKYDAQTRDATWICAFCKKGPHDRSLSPSAGDLFGPYFITTDCPEYEKRLHDPYDVQFKSKKVRKAVEAVPGAVGGKKGGRKSDDDVLLGITETVNKTYEVWAHEDCIVWSPGTYLIGPKIVGLEEAVWTCCNVVCKYCGHKGANICCLKRGCTAVMHVNCARANDWRFNESNFKAFCPTHAPSNDFLK